MSESESGRPEERKQAEDDAKEDLELKDEEADQVRGGKIISKWPGAPEKK